jgi:hypothetical protein
MTNKKGYLISISFMLTVFVSVLFSCKRKDTFVYTHNYRIDSISMYRIDINDTINTANALYLFDAIVSDCNQETNDKLSGRLSHDLGSIDSICGISFFKNNQEIPDSTISIYKKYNDVNITHIYLKENAHGENEAKVESWNLVNLNDAIEILQNRYLSGSRGINDSLRHFYFIFTIDKKQALPDSMSIKFQDRSLSTKIVNSPVKKYVVSRFKEGEDLILD